MSGEPVPNDQSETSKNKASELVSERDRLRRDVKRRVGFWSGVALSLIGFSYIFTSLYGRYRREQGVSDALAEITNGDIKFNEISSQRLNELTPNALLSGGIITVDYDNGNKRAVCLGSYIEAEQSGVGSTVLFATAAHCIPEEYLPNSATVATINDVANRHIQDIRTAGNPYEIVQLIPFGDKSVGVVLKTDVKLDELWMYGVNPIGKSSFLYDPKKLYESGEPLEALSYLGNDFVPYPVKTDFYRLSDKNLVASLVDHVGNSGLNFFAQSGGWVGTLEYGISTGDTLISVPTIEQKTNLISTWESMTGDVHGR